MWKIEKLIIWGLITLDATMCIVLLVGYGKRMYHCTESQGNTVITAGNELEKMEDKKEKKEKYKIAITFDDGPHPTYTEQLLDGLKQRNVRATFFVTGEHAEAYPKLIQRMKEEGHLVGNHTYSHLQLKKSNATVFREELIQTNKIIREITGEEVNFVRPPYGTWNKLFEKELSMIPVLWTIDPLDWSVKNADIITETVIKQAEENGIILLHDCYDTSVISALRIIDILQKKGYRFVTVDEVMFD